MPLSDSSQQVQSSSNVNLKAEKMKTYEKTIRSRVESEERAFKIVNKLIDGHVIGDYLTDCAHFINPDHYKDIVEERAISQICGYPVCPNQLGKTPTKKYHISLKTNKVYEISERKNFCSNQCFKASRHFASQILESPLWMRDKEKAPNISLLQQDKISGIIGEEVIGGNPKDVLKEDLKDLSQLDRKTMTKVKQSARQSNEKNPEIESVKDKRISSSTHLPGSLHTQKPGAIDCNRLVGETKSNLSMAIKSISKEVMLEEKSVCLENPSSSNFSKKIELENFEAKEVHKGSSADADFINRFKELSTNKDSSGLPYSEAKDGETNQLADSSTNLSSVDKINVDDTSTSKMDRLKILMSKRKNILSEMVDLQTVDGSSVNQANEKSKPAAEKSNELSRKNTFAVSESPFIKPLSPSLAAAQYSSQDALCSTHKIQNSRSTAIPKAKQPLLIVGDILKSWMSRDTAFYLVTSGGEENSLARFKDGEVQQGYAQLCQRLAAQEKELDGILDNGVSGDDGKTQRPLKPVPDYKALKEQTEAFNLNVMEFITGKKQKPSQKDADTPQDSQAICLPTVDAYDQHQIRVKIVLDWLNKCLPDLLTPLKLSAGDVASPVREIIQTCSLNKNNIVLKPGEWTLTALLLLAVLATRYPSIKSAFGSDQAIRHFTPVLSRLGHSLADLHGVAQEVINTALSLR